MRTFGKLVLTAVGVFAILQVVRPSIPTKAPTAELQAPPEVKRIIEKSCYSCHSDQRRLSWFDYIVPGYWLVRHDILTARKHVNFSTLGTKPVAAQKATLYEAVNMIQLGAMPLPSFLALHPDAKVTPEELATLKAYLAPWRPSPDQPANAPGTSGTKNDAAPAAVPDGSLRPASYDSVRPEFNGLPFDPGYKSWKPISTTDRGDNNTFRLILGNDIAVKAAQSGNITPWPDGTRFAKIAWQQQPGPDGLVHPGKFVQVEFMVKDARRFRDTEGWNWGRWRGLDLEPYGKDAHFLNECTECHRPVSGDDHVYTLPVTAATVSRNEIVNNLAAALPSTLPYQPLGWNAITLYVDPKTRSTATLFGNDVATKATQTPSLAGNGTYPEGAVLALVTWAQRDDPHWFGARIPSVPQSVEFVQVTGMKSSSYRRFAGVGLAEEHPADAVASQRTGFLLGPAPVSLP